MTMYVMSLTQSWFAAVGIKSLTMFGYVGNPCVESVEPILVHDPQLHATDTRIDSPYIVDKLKREVLPGGSCQNGILIVFIIGLLTHTKQCAKIRHSIFSGGFCVQGCYCLAPAFFLIGMLNFFSAISIIVS